MPALYFISRAVSNISSVPKEIYDDLSQKDVESLSGRTLSSANSKLLIHCRNDPFLF
jgi:hypothetical protein